MVTLHRPSNVDEAAALQALVDAIASVDDDLDVVFPAHPRTTARLDEFGVTLPSAITTTGDRHGCHLVKDPASPLVAAP